MAASQFGDGIRGADVAALQSRQDILGRWRVSHVDLSERETGADSIQSVLYRRIADAEELFHLFNGAVAANEGRHEHLVFGGQLRERGRLKGALNRDASVDDLHAF